MFYVKVTLLFFMLTFGVSLNCVANPGIGKVYFDGFEKQRITGLHESELEVLCCIFTIKRKEFDEILNSEAAPVIGYNSKDVRAKIVFGKNIYFIDRQGTVRFGDKVMVIDKDKFTKLVKLVRCPSKLD